MFSQRLLALAQMIIEGEVTADIGADHGGLARFLVENKIVSRVIATELGDGPYQRLLAGVADSPYRGMIEIRQGDGLSVLLPGETANVVIAGLGGEAMVEILSADYNKACSFKRFVFQPMSRAGALRRELSRRGWPILEERLINENGRLFVALGACPGDTPYRLTPLEIDVGPLLLRQDSAYKIPFLRSCLNKYRLACKGLMQATGDYNIALSEYRGKIRELEAILNGSTS